MVSFASAILLILFVVLAIALVLNIGIPTVSSGISSSEIRDAESHLKTLDNFIEEVAREGDGAQRLFKFSAPRDFVLIQEEDAVQFDRGIDIQTFDYLTRSFEGNMVFIGGGDVSCRVRDDDSDGLDDLVAENSNFKAVFKRTAEVTPNSDIDTAESIMYLQEKTNGLQVNITNSSVIIDGNDSSAIGTGYSEILRTGDALPSCTVHFFVNASVAYDAYYTLYSGADFLVAEVRNVRS